MGHAGVGVGHTGVGGSCRVGQVMQGWAGCGSCRGGVGHAGVGCGGSYRVRWVIQGWGGS